MLPEPNTENSIDFDDARYRIMYPEKYIIKKIGSAVFHIENSRLIYRTINSNFEIDFTDYHGDDYSKIIIRSLDGNEVLLSKYTIEHIDNFINRLKFVLKLSAFKKAFEHVSFKDSIFIKGNEEECSLYFYGSHNPFVKPGFKLCHNGGIEYINNYEAQLSLDTKLCIKQISQILIEQTLNINKEMMDEALE